MSSSCITAAKDARAHTVQASQETLARTTLGIWEPGRAVNLERSLRLGDELGGHLVFGHVDAVGEIATIEPDGDCHRLAIAVAPELAPMLAVKGSVAVDGISLTVNEAGPDRFAVTIIQAGNDSAVCSEPENLPSQFEGSLLDADLAQRLMYVRLCEGKFVARCVELTSGPKM